VGILNVAAECQMNRSCNHRKDCLPFKDEGQTALFKDPFRTAQ